MAGTGGFIFGASPKANNETRSLTSPPSSLTSGKKTSPIPIIDRGFNQSTNSPSPVVSPRRPFKFGPCSSAVEKEGPQASQSAFNCDYSTPASAMPHSMYGLDRSKPQSSRAPPTFSFGSSESASQSFQTPFTHTSQVANPEPATCDPAKTSVIERSNAKDFSTARSTNSMLFSPTSKLDSLTTTKTAELVLTHEAVNGGISPSKPGVERHFSVAKRKVDESNAWLPDDNKRARQDFWHESRYANLTILCNGKTWKCDCVMLFWRCPALEFACSSSSVAGQFELRLDDEDPETLGSLLSYLRADLLPRFATLEKASCGLRIGIKYGVSEYKAHAKKEILAVFDAVEHRERRVEEFVASLPIWWDMDQDHVGDIKSAALKVIANKAELLLARDDFRSLAKSNGADVLDAIGVLAAACQPMLSVGTTLLSLSENQDGEDPAITDSQARWLFQNNKVIRRLLAIEIEKSVEKSEGNLCIEFSVARAETARQLQSLEGKFASCQGKIKAVQRAASETPNMAVRDAWNVAKVAKAVPITPGHMNYH